MVNRQSNSITPSTSSHHITSRERDMDSSTGSKDVADNKSFGTNHSLDRGHGHSHSHHHHHHHHHHSLDRDGGNLTNHSNLSCNSTTRGQVCNTPPSSSVVAKSRSSTSNNSLTLSNHIHSSEEQLNQHRKSNVDVGEWNDNGCSRGGSDRSRPMMKPPKDPKSTNHHHHSRHKLNDEHPHQHHHQHQHRKKSIGSVGDPDGNSLGGMRKISAAGSVSSVLSENSMGSYSKSRTNSNDFSHKMPAN